LGTSPGYYAPPTFAASKPRSLHAVARQKVPDTCSVPFAPVPRCPQRPIERLKCFPNLRFTTFPWLYTGVLVAMILVVYGSIFATLRLAADHAHRLGETPIKISSRLMGLILVGLGVQFVVDGLRATGLFG